MSAPVLSAPAKPVNAARVYFPNLNAIRFIAALAVIIHHVEGARWKSGLPNAYDVPFIIRIGKLGVALFFVLSGFLITYLLLVEEASTSRINIKEFYIRRILRIWPVYYLVLALSVLVFPFVPALIENPYYQVDFGSATLVPQIILYLLFFPNLAQAAFGGIPFARQSWSVGTEEQFYLIWPLLMARVKRHRLVALLVIVGLYLLMQLALGHLPGTIPGLSIVRGYWRAFPISCMAIGGIFAVLTYRKAEILQRFIFPRATQFIVLGTTILLIGFGIELPLDYECYALLFAIIITNLAANPDRILTMETPWLNYLGKISYGLYMYHAVIIVFSLYVLQHTIGVSSFALYSLTLLGTVAVSALSYQFMEEKLIRFKARFSRVLSGENAR